MILKSFPLVFLFVTSAHVISPFDDGGRSLIGTKPPEFEEIQWLTKFTIHLEELRGKVVLIRWWTGPQCPFCAPSIQALNGLSKEFGDKGLVVIGLYHHKSTRPLDEHFVAEQSRRWGIRFAVGIDKNWHNLDRWWLQTGERNWTSVSFLLDSAGVIRYIHPGGAYSADPLDIFHTAQEDYQTLRSFVQKLLGEEQDKK